MSTKAEPLNRCANCDKPCYGKMCRRCNHIDTHVPVIDRSRREQRTRTDYELNPEMDLRF